MFKKLAKRIAEHVLPMVLDELVYLLEKWMNEDINKDGKIGR